MSIVAGDRFVARNRHFPIVGLVFSLVKIGRRIIVYARHSKIRLALERLAHAVYELVVIIQTLDPGAGEAQGVARVVVAARRSANRHRKYCHLYVEERSAIDSPAEILPST